MLGGFPCRLEFRPRSGFWCIFEGDTETGVTCHRMVEVRDLADFFPIRGCPGQEVRINGDRISGL